MKKKACTCSEVVQPHTVLQSLILHEMLLIAQVLLSTSELGVCLYCVCVQLVRVNVCMLMYVLCKSVNSFFSTFSILLILHYVILSTGISPGPHAEILSVPVGYLISICHLYQTCVPLSMSLVLQFQSCVCVCITIAFASVIVNQSSLSFSVA